MVSLFCVDLNATQIAKAANLNRNTVNRILPKIRDRIAFAIEAESPVSGEVEADDSYFGACRERGLGGGGPEKKLLCLDSLKEMENN